MQLQLDDKQLLIDNFSIIAAKPYLQYPVCSFKLLEGELQEEDYLGKTINLNVDNSIFLNNYKITLLTKEGLNKYTIEGVKQNVLY